MIGQPSESAVRPALGRSSGNSKKKNKRAGTTGTERRPRGKLPQNSENRRPGWAGEGGTEVGRAGTGRANIPEFIPQLRVATRVATGLGRVA